MTTSESSTMDVHDSYATLRLPDYRRLLIGNVLAAIGFEMQNTAVGWELYDRTHDPAALGYVGLALFLPVFLLALPAGHVADRFDRQRVLVVFQLIAGLAAVALAGLSYYEGPTLLIYALLSVVGICQAFRMPARAALISQIVPAHLLASAVTWNSSGWHIALMAGPALGGYVISAAGHVGSAYLLSAACMFACGVLVLAIRPNAAPRYGGQLSLQSLMAGLRFVRDTKLLLATMTLDLFAVLLGGATALLPIFASDILHIGADGFGWLRAAPAIGALAMALTMAHRPPLRRAGPTLLWAVTGFGIATIVFGLSTDPVLSFAALALTGALDNISVVVRGTLIQTRTPNEMRGRVSAVNSIFIGSSNQLGEFESGMTAKWFAALAPVFLGFSGALGVTDADMMAKQFGTVASVVFGGIGTISVVLLVMWRWPEVARLRSLSGEVKMQPELAEAAAGSGGQP